MDYPNVEKSKRFKSKIPVKAASKPPNRIPVLASINRNAKSDVKLNPVIKQNATSLSSLNPTIANLPKSKTERPGVKDRGKKPADVAAKSNGHRPTVIVPKNIENKRFTNIAKQNENKRLADVETNIVNRRHTNMIANKFRKNISNALDKQSQLLKNPVKTKTETNLKKSNPISSKQKQDHRLNVQRNPVADARSKVCENDQGKEVNKQAMNVKRAQNELKDKVVSKEQASNTNICDEEPEIQINKEPIKQSSNHFSQPNIEFVADEKYRDLILSGKELTPRTLKMSNNVKYSSIFERGSIYKNSKTPADSFKAALRAIENTDLAAEDRRVSEMRRTASCFVASPLKDRFSLYKQFNPAIDPYEVALKRLEQLEMKKKVKSVKKVTFNLTSTDSASKPVENNENVKSAGCESRLTDIGKKNVKSKQSTTPELCVNILSTPPKVHSPVLESLNFAPVTDEVERTPSPAQFKQMLIRICGQSTTMQKKQNIPSKHIPQENAKEQSLFTDKTGAAKAPSSKVTIKSENDFASYDKSLSYAKVQHETLNSNLYSKSVGPQTKQFNSVSALEHRSSLYSARSQNMMMGSCHKRGIFSKLCTPKPVSLYPQAKLTDSISPEFLNGRTPNIAIHAPITTPMVLRRLADNSDLQLSPCDQDQPSPVCQKLNFDEVLGDKGELNDGGISEREDSTEIHLQLQGILTNHKILDHLADQECNVLLSSATFPVISGRYLQNPVAGVLNYGDEMHFVPVELT